MARGKLKDKRYMSEQAVIEKFDYDVENRNVYDVYCRKVHFTGNIIQIIDWFSSLHGHYLYEWLLKSCILIKK